MFILEITVFCFFGAATIYVLFFSIVACFYRTHIPNAVSADQKASFAILIPAYKEDEVILSVVDNMLNLDYPNEKYRVFVIADQLKPETLSLLKNKDIEVVPVSFEKSTKTKSLNACISQMDIDAYDLMVISDADNILSKDFLLLVNQAFFQGHKVIQGRRVAKNLNTDFAVLDGASEIINNHIFRLGPSTLGLSASLIGSGMAFDMKKIVEYLDDIKAVGGFDKVLQLKVIGDGIRIKYLPDALVYDEKVDSKVSFSNQRRRWLSSQYRYLFSFFSAGVKKLFQGNFDYFNVAILGSLFLPRILNLGFLFLFTLLSFLLSEVLNISYIFWAFLFGTYVFALLIALPRRFYNRKLFYAVIKLPSAFLAMLFQLFRLKGADKKFIHTKHSSVNIDNETL